VLARASIGGLAARARNTPGSKTAAGSFVAFIDADARADRDWLYHLVETINPSRRGSRGRPQISRRHPPQRSRPRSPAAPGQPALRSAPATIRSSNCGGCNMIVEEGSGHGGRRIRPDVHHRWRRRRFLVAARRARP